MIGNSEKTQQTPSTRNTTAHAKAPNTAIPAGAAEQSTKISNRADGTATDDILQQQQQELVDRETEASPAEKAQAAAVELLEQGAFSRALATAAAAAKLPGGAEIHHALATLRLVCRLHLAGPRANCWQMLGLEEGAAADEVRRAFRKGAARVHPDKCRLPRAEDAFKLLAAAADKALSGSSSAERSSVPDDVQSAAAGGPAWWEEWDPTAEEQAQQEEPGRKRKAWDAPADSDTQFLANMSLQALRAEVVRRQAAVLSPQPGSQEASMDRILRQARLREARTLLAEKLRQEDEEAATHSAGGFNRDPAFSHFS